MEVGDIVEVNDGGLIMLQRFAPKGSIPNNQGVIKEITTTEYYVLFPIGRDNPKEHSQLSPYPKHQVRIKKDYHKFMEKVRDAVLTTD